MSIYPVVLFLHIVGAIGYFLSIGIWLFILVALRRAQHIEKLAIAQVGAKYDVVFVGPALDG